jgi:hypothetical protein
MYPQMVAGVIADAADLAVLASMSESERLEVVKRLAKMQKKAEQQARVRVLDVHVLTARGIKLSARNRAD